MTNIEKISKIKLETLSSEQYFQSLLEQGYKAKMLSEPELEKIQFDTLALMAKQTQSFNGGGSSSIPIEKAQDILSSAIFTIGVHLKTYAFPDDALAAVQKMGVEMIWAQGCKRIDRLIKQTKMRHGSLINRLLQTENAFYSSTIKDGINGFFKLYDTQFAAHEIHITADYPVYNESQVLLGIEFISQYVEQLNYENLFCKHFSHVDIHYLLLGYDENYKNLLFNIYEPVLAAALGCVIADVHDNGLEITPAIQSFLYNRFVGKEAAEIEQILGCALSKLGENLSLSESLIKYTNQSLPLLASTIENECKTGGLKRVFIVPQFFEANRKITISFGEKMDDELYRVVWESFMNGTSSDERIDIVKKYVHSLADLEDLLLDSQLDENEIIEILKRLNPAEVAALMKKYSANYEMSFTELRDCEKVLYHSLHKFTASLPLEQQAMLETTVKILEVE